MKFSPLIGSISASAMTRISFKARDAIQTIQITTGLALVNRRDRLPGINPGRDSIKKARFQLFPRSARKTTAIINRLRTAIPHTANNLFTPCKKGATAPLNIDRCAKSRQRHEARTTLARVALA